MGRLTGRTAIIAGGSKGIGYAISTTFAREGAEVAVVGSNAEAAEKTAQEIREASGKAIAVAADLTSEEGRAQVLTKTLAAFGKVDILINNAGWGCKSSFLETDMASLRPFHQPESESHLLHGPAGSQADDRPRLRRAGNQYLIHSRPPRRAEFYHLLCH